MNTPQQGMSTTKSLQMNLQMNLQISLQQNQGQTRSSLKLWTYNPKYTTTKQESLPTYQVEATDIS